MLLHKTCIDGVESLLVHFTEHCDLLCCMCRCFSLPLSFSFAVCVFMCKATSQCNISNAVILHEMNEQCRDKSIEAAEFTQSREKDIYKHHGVQMTRTKMYYVYIIFEFNISTSNSQLSIPRYPVRYFGERMSSRAMPGNDANTGIFTSDIFLLRCSQCKCTYMCVCVCVSTFAIWTIFALRSSYQNCLASAVNVQ